VNVAVRCGRAMDGPDPQVLLTRRREPNGGGIRVLDVVQFLGGVAIRAESRVVLPALPPAEEGDQITERVLDPRRVKDRQAEQDAFNGHGGGVDRW
jgi:hypothetical protein